MKLQEAMSQLTLAAICVDQLAETLPITETGGLFLRKGRNSCFE